MHHTLKEIWRAVNIGTFQPKDSIFYLVFQPLDISVIVLFYLIFAEFNLMFSLDSQSTKQNPAKCSAI